MLRVLIHRYLRPISVIALAVLVWVGATTLEHTTAASVNNGGASPPVTFGAARPSTTFGPNCDPRTGRVAIPSVYAAPCVVSFHGDNGGQTWPGVTKTTIVVAVYIAAPDILQSGTLGGGSGDSQAQTMQTIADYVHEFESHYETYGRRVKLVRVDASGGSSDDAAGRADAIRVATEIKAFASFGGPTGTDAYFEELAAHHVLCIGCTTGTTDALVRANAPYVWGIQPSPEQLALEAADFIAKQPAGTNAAYAGEAVLRAHTRSFGLVAYDTPGGTFHPVWSQFDHELATRGVRLTTTVTYTLDLTRAQEDATTIIARLRDAGVTTVIFAGDPLMPIFLTQEATRQHWFPEWVVTGTFLTDTAAFSRLYDHQQWAHAFGISELPGRVQEVDNEPYRMHVWQFGTPPPARSSYPLLYPDPLMFFTGVQLAGADLTPHAFAQGLFSFPPSGGGPTNPRISFGRHGAWPTLDYLGFDDATEIWWDPSATGPDEIGREGRGLYRYVDGGHRYLAGAWPTKRMALFDPATAVTIFDPPPDPPPSYPSPAPARP